MVRKPSWNNPHAVPPSVAPARISPALEHYGAVQYIGRHGMAGGKAVLFGDQPGSGGIPAFQWTTNTPSGDSTIIYVADGSATPPGNDSTGNGSISAPYATPNKALSVAAALPGAGAGLPTWIQLKCGSTFSGALSNWTLSGRSASEPFVFGQYGTGARPKINSGSSTALFCDLGVVVQNVRFVGVEFYCGSYAGAPSGGDPKLIYWIGNTTNILWEDCYFHDAWQVVTVAGGGRHTNIRFRACVVTRGYETISANDSQGLYIASTDTVLIEDCIFDQCGWVSGAEATDRKHSVYVQNGCTGVTAKNNIWLNTDGFQLRPGGVATGNVGSRVRIGMYVGTGDGPIEAGGVTVTVEDNVFLEGQFQAAINNAVIGFYVANVVGGTIKRNIFYSSTGSSAQVFWLQNDGSWGRAITNTVLADNLASDWGGFGFNVSAPTVNYSNNTVQRNEIQNPTNAVLVNAGAVWSSDTGQCAWTSAQFACDHNHWAQAVNGGPDPASWSHRINVARTFAQTMSDLSDTTSDQVVTSYPNRTNATLGAYNGSIGGTATHAAFATAVTAQSRQTWNEKLRAVYIVPYIKAIFGR